MITARNQAILDKTRDTDEPVIVFRAQDCLAAVMLNHYANLATDAGADREFVAVVEDVRQQFIDWGEAHPDRLKVPDL
jgi:hypothetical protein